MKLFYVSIMAGQRNGTLYTGVTSNLTKRTYEHKNDLVDGFTKTYRVHMLVWFEEHQTAELAITREKQVKKWNRSWKLELIESGNPEWRDLCNDLVNNPGFPRSRE